MSAAPQITTQPTAHSGRGKSASRVQLINRLAGQYRKVMKDGFGERAFGEALERYSISPDEMKDITRIARQKIAELPY